MRLIDLYKLAVKKGIEKDVRGKAGIKKTFDAARAEYRKLKGADKKAFDKEKLTNPYADTRILYGDPDTEVRTVLAGIDMEGPELLLADRLNQSDRRSIDLVLAHHPEGRAWAKLNDVMALQANMLNKFGIPMDIASDLLKDRSDEVSRALAGANHFRSIDIARLLDIPFMCLHTVADNHVASYLQKIFDRTKPKKLSNALDILKRIPEYADGMKKGAGPTILIGEPGKKAGKIFVDMTGGTEGPKRVYSRLSQAGVGTVVGMHFSEDHYKYAKEEHMNLIVAGHIASDNLGLNLLLDEIGRSARLNVIACSGFMRINR
ncbi:MAG: NGG1p interacting factor NIF3 [Candidatus Omnitrophica bacterium]|nr:NGG1p interacting factor NIF3 [Candidatus Omnitrophota bacterium]